MNEDREVRGGAPIPCSREVLDAVNGYFGDEDGLFVWHPLIPVFGRMAWGSITHVPSARSLAKAICCLALLVAGCRPASPPPPDLRPWIAVTGVYAMMSPSPAPLPPAPAPGAACENCRGTGKVGDSVVGETCPICGGTGVTPAKAPAAPLPPVPTVGVSPARSAAPGLPVPTEEAPAVLPAASVEAAGPTFRVVCEDGVCRRIKITPR